MDYNVTAGPLAHGQRGSRWAADMCQVRPDWFVQYVYQSDRAGTPEAAAAVNERWRLHWQTWCGN